VAHRATNSQRTQTKASEVGKLFTIWQQFEKKKKKKRENNQLGEATWLMMRLLCKVGS